ncbi:DUF4760 domain-containing protein [Candidatus Latescibacterota bacterium]
MYIYCNNIYIVFSESVALGIKHKILDDDIVFDYLGSLIPENYRWSEPYIKKIREKADDKLIFIELSLKAEDYKERNEEMQKKSVETLR